MVLSGRDWDVPFRWEEKPWWRTFNILGKLTSGTWSNVSLLSWMKIHITRSKAMVLSRKRVGCFLQMRGETLPLMEYLETFSWVIEKDSQMGRVHGSSVIACLPVDPYLYLYLGSGAVDSDWKNKIMSTCGGDESLLKVCWSYSLWQGKEFSNLGKPCSRATATLNWEKQVEVVWAPYKDAHDRFPLQACS